MKKQDADKWFRRMQNRNVHHDIVQEAIKLATKEINAGHWHGYAEEIYYKDGFLFSYYEYVGDDYAADMAKMAADPETQRWWAVCEPCQQPLDTSAEGEWWASMEEVFHQD